MPATNEMLPQAQTPPTPVGFIIRTPPPKVAQLAPASTPICFVPAPVNMGSILIDCLPFYQFNSIFSREGNPFSRNTGGGGPVSLALSKQDIFSSVNGFQESGDKKGVLGTFHQMVKALMPENIFASNPTRINMTISPGEEASVMDFLRFTIYLISNNFFGGPTDVGEKIYKWVKSRSNAGLLEYLLSIGGPTIEALVEHFFRLALDAEDAVIVKKLMDLGVDCNEQRYRTYRGSCMTPLQRACELQSLELVRVLIDGGAKANLRGTKGSQSALSLAVEPFGERYGIKEEQVDIELVRILLRAGAAVNPGFGESPLARAACGGHVEVVTLLVSAGADVHFLEDGTLCTPLMKAVERESSISERDLLRIVRTLLQAGADPQAITSYDYGAITVLDAAMSKKSVELIQLLLDNGARVTESAFVKAVKICNMGIAKLLLKTGAQVTKSVVEAAVQHEERELVFILLNAANDSIKDSCKSAALIKAIKHGKMDLVDWLDTSGAQLNSGFQTVEAIQATAERGDMPMLRLILSGDSRHRASVVESLGGALQVAISNGRNDIVEILLTAGADVNSQAVEGNKKPLLTAVHRKDLYLVQKLLAAGAAVNGSYYQSSLGYSCTTSVLPAAVAGGNYPLIREIVNAGAELNAPETMMGKTALFVAIEKGDLATIKLLIDAGADLNTPAAIASGNTALVAASRNNSVEMVRYLVGLGADPDEWSLIAAVSGSVELVQTILEARFNRYQRYSKGYGCGALQYAINLKNTTMIAILLANGIDANLIIRRKFGDKIGAPSRDYLSVEELTIIYGESALGSAIKTDNSDDLRIVHMLLRSGADPNSIVSDNHQTALLAAISQNNLALVKALIDAGANPNPSTIFGVSRTPLQLAVERGRMEIVHILLEHSVDVNAPPYDRYGATALQFAAISGYLGIAHVLLEKGADVNAPPAKVGGRTALEAAAEHGRIDMLQLLLKAGAQVIGVGLKQYERAREFASINGHISAQRLLEAYRAKTLEYPESWDPISTDFGFLDDFIVLDF